MNFLRPLGVGTNNNQGKQTYPGSKGVILWDKKIWIDLLPINLHKMQSYDYSQDIHTVCKFD